MCVFDSSPGGFECISWAHMKACVLTLISVGVWALGYLWPHTQHIHTHSLSSPLFEWLSNIVCRRGTGMHQCEGRAFHLGRRSYNMLSWGVFMHRFTVWREIKEKECLLVTWRRKCLTPQQQTSVTLTTVFCLITQLKFVCMLACPYFYGFACLYAQRGSVQVLMMKYDLV